ncbi:USP6 N-terminal-like protein [Vulpes lagopus]
MQEDLETLLALQRANIVAQYHQFQGAAQPQPPQGQETPPGDPARQQIDKNAQAMGPLPPQQEGRWVYKGVPPQVRGQVWLRLLNVDQVKARNAGKYQEMKEAALVSSRDIMQIDLDINRTFHSHTMFWDRYGVGQRAFFHVLATYSVYNTMSEVGYCQGMSEIAAILLMFLPEDAFWALAQLMTDDRHAMHGFQKLLRFQAHHEPVLERALPDLRKHMDEEQMSTSIYTPKWFLQCFLSGTPFSLTLKLWDAYIPDGERVLTAMAYTILKVHRTPPEAAPGRALGVLQDSLAQPWALEDEEVLRHLWASMTQLRKIQCDLPRPQPGGPQAKAGRAGTHCRAWAPVWGAEHRVRPGGHAGAVTGPEEFPTRPLGLERVSPVPGPLLPSPASETLPRVEEQASLGPATQPEPPRPPPGQAIVQFPPSDGTPSPSSQCNKTVQAGGPQTWA